MENISGVSECTRCHTLIKGLKPGELCGLCYRQMELVEDAQQEKLFALASSIYAKWCPPVSDTMSNRKEIAQQSIKDAKVFIKIFNNE